MVKGTFGDTQAKYGLLALRKDWFEINLSVLKNYGDIQLKEWFWMSYSFGRFAIAKSRFALMIRAYFKWKLADQV